MNRSFVLSAVLAALLAACDSPSTRPPTPETAARTPSPAPAVATSTRQAATLPTQPQAAPAKSRPQAAALPATRMKPEDRDAILAYHNLVRANVGVGPLQWDDDIAAYAQQWADRLAANGCRMQHRQPNDYGENLYQGTAGRYTAVDAAKGWETEKKRYLGGVLSKKNYARVGHYTQMTWRGSARLGCGEALCNGTLLVACNYDPPGNYLGRKPY